jgi:hypothetical protein
MGLELTRDEIKFIVNAITIADNEIGNLFDKDRNSFIEKLDKYSIEAKFPINAHKLEINGYKYYDELRDDMCGCDPEYAANEYEIESIENSLINSNSSTLYLLIRALKYTIDRYINKNLLYGFINNDDNDMMIFAKCINHVKYALRDNPQVLDKIDIEFYKNENTGSIDASILTPGISIESARTIPVYHNTDELCSILNKHEFLNIEGVK